MKALEERAQSDEKDRKSNRRDGREREPPPAHAMRAGKRDDHPCELDVAREENGKRQLPLRLETGDDRRVVMEEVHHERDAPASAREERPRPPTDVRDGGYGGPKRLTASKPKDEVHHRPEDEDEEDGSR
jgi:hypothetical protein